MKESGKVTCLSAELVLLAQDSVLLLGHVRAQTVADRGSKLLASVPLGRERVQQHQHLYETTRIRMIAPRTTKSKLTQERKTEQTHLNPNMTARERSRSNNIAHIRIDLHAVLLQQLCGLAQWLPHRIGCAGAVANTQQIVHHTDKLLVVALRDGALHAAGRFRDEVSQLGDVTFQLAGEVLGEFVLPFADLRGNRLNVQNISRARSKNRESLAK